MVMCSMVAAAKTVKIPWFPGVQTSLGQMMCPQTATYPWPASHTNGTLASPLPQMTHWSCGRV
jgi:hypothetical protein